jgi:hypothetical protein
MTSDVERLLRSALVPLDPPGSLSERLDERLSEVTALAFDELGDIDLDAMRDPRNWARPAAALVIGGAAAGALVLVRARRQSKKQPGVWQALERGMQDVGADIERRLKRP